MTTVVLYSSQTSRTVLITSRDSTDLVLIQSTQTTLAAMLENQGSNSSRICRTRPILYINGMIKSLTRVVSVELMLLIRLILFTRDPIRAAIILSTKKLHNTLVNRTWPILSPRLPTTTEPRWPVAMLVHLLTKVALWQPHTTVKTCDLLRRKIDCKISPILIPCSSLSKATTPMVMSLIQEPSVTARSRISIMRQVVNFLAKMMSARHLTMKMIMTVRRLKPQRAPLQTTTCRMIMSSIAISSLVTHSNSNRVSTHTIVCATQLLTMVMHMVVAISATTRHTCTILSSKITMAIIDKTYQALLMLSLLSSSTHLPHSQITMPCLTITLDLFAALKTTMILLSMLKIKS